MPVHPVNCSPAGETLGWDLAPERLVVGESRRGLGCLRTAMLHVASCGWASEDEISSLVGHFTFRALVRRELMATLSAAYAFSQRGGRQRRRSWVPVIQELRVAASLIFLAHRHLSAPWCHEVLLFDASPWGGAAVAALIPPIVVKETGRSCDRWRFSRRQEFDVVPRSVMIEGTSHKPTQRSTHQPLSSRSSPPTALPYVPDVPR